MGVINPQNPPSPIGGKHTLLLKNREHLSLEGVLEVIRFDEEAVILKTEGGQLTVEGEGLHVKKLLLEAKEAVIEGKILSLSYTDRSEVKKDGLLGRLFG